MILDFRISTVLVDGVISAPVAFKIGNLDEQHGGDLRAGVAMLAFVELCILQTEGFSGCRMSGLYVCN